ncbi:MAG TPA: proline dehydrogenase family protein [Candidatus Rubrimentiphilum sp.]|nr:proline dehydrogenase family protein [Candidatus Rubrimentiphilum sp.]
MATLDRFFAPDSTFQKRCFFLAKRFVAGKAVDEAIAAVRELNDAGISASLDFLGEDVLERDAAAKTRETYMEIFDAIKASGVGCNVSVKLTALGLLIDENLGFQNLAAILERAKTNPDPFVRIDMEGSAVTDSTLRVFERAYTEYGNVGSVLQAYLKRTPGDVERMIELGARVRLCKGAYNEPASIAYKEMPQIREQYIRCARELLTRGNYPGIATHDRRLIAAVKDFVKEKNIARDRFEFQMIYGVRPQLQRELVNEGYGLRVYVPFGTHWAAYFYRRVAERKENLLFALSSIFSR